MSKKLWEASQTKKKIICFDGDGSITMHLGSLATSSQFNNIIHVVFNNKSHESVGGHYTSSKHISFFKLAKNLGYKTTMQAKNKKQALLCIKKALKNKHSCFVIDAALIYESGADTHMDYVIVITSLLRYRTERVMSRNNITRDDFLKRVSLQWPDEDKVHMADFVIHNNSTEEKLSDEARNVFDLLT